MGESLQQLGRQVVVLNSRFHNIVLFFSVFEKLLVAEKEERLT